MIRADELRGLSALGGLPVPTLDRIAALAEERRVGKGRTLYRAGDPVDGLYIILSGRVRVSRETASRAELLHNEDAGGVLGEIPVFSGGPFPATAIALEATRCAHVPRAAVERLLREDSAFVNFALARLAERARVLLHRIDELTAMTVGARVAGYVLGRAGQSLGAPFTLGMSQEELANELGTAREVVVRALRSLVAAGAIERAGRSRFVLGNRAILRAMASTGR